MIRPLLLISLLLASMAMPNGYTQSSQESASPPKEEQIFDFDEMALGRALRILATMAKLNYIEPELDPKETIALTLKGMSAKEAFFEVARTRGFTIRERNGVVQLLRDGTAERGHLVTRRYPLKNIDAHLVIQPVADYLGIRLTAPAPNSPAFPVPQEQGNSQLGRSSHSDSGGFSSTGRSTTSGYGTSSGTQNGNRSRFTPALPMDAPFSEGGHHEFKNSVYVERSTNALVVRATESQHEELATYIANHDVVEPQLVIEAQILEIDIDRAKNLGLDWKFSGGNGLGTGSVQTADGGLSATFGYVAGGAILSQREVSATLRALESHNCSTTVSNARVVTRSGVAALINNSVETPIELSTVFGDGTTTTAQTGTETFVTGVILDVLPRILDNGYIDLNLNPTVATQVGSVKGSSGQELPIISKRNATTSVVVKDGYTVGIGGLVQETNTRTRSQTPIFGKIPVLGYLFQGFAQTKRRTNLVILVTPRIIHTPRFLDDQLSAEDEAALPKKRSSRSSENRRRKESKQWPRATKVSR